MNPIANYFRGLTERFGAGWNRFWFTAADPLPICVLRALAGLLALWYLLSHSLDLVTWFGADGLLPVEAVRQLATEPDGGWNARASYLYYLDQPALLRTVHALGICVLTAFTAGLASRITSVLSLGIVLSYVHRAPAITGPFEPVLTMILFYLCLAPCGQVFSVDHWLRRRRQEPIGPVLDPADPPASVAAGVCLRLIQLHVAGFYIMMALNKLGGSDSWWTGEAMWWLLARTESRLVDFTSLARREYLINFWTQAVVGVELLFGLLIWNRWARPLLLFASVVHWILIGLVTSLLSFVAAMIAVNVVFVSPDTLRWFFGQRDEKK